MFTLNNPVKLDDLSGYSVTSHPCPHCGIEATVKITPNQLWLYNQGSGIQQVLGDYDHNIREQFISGYCGRCWDTIFGDDD